MGCCNRSAASYTVRRYGADGRTLWVRDYYKDANWGQTSAATDPSLWRLSVAANTQRVFVGGPLVGHQFGGVVASKWNFICYEASGGSPLFRRNVWDDVVALGGSLPGFPVQYNVVDVCLGPNGQIGVLTAAAEMYADAIGEADPEPPQAQAIVLYKTDGTPLQYVVVAPPEDCWFLRIKIDLAGSIHLSGQQADGTGRPDFQRVIALPVGSGELIGCVWLDTSVLLPQLALRYESAPGIVVWSTHIADIRAGEEVTDLALASNGDVLAAGTGFHLAGVAGPWGRFSSVGIPTFVGVDTIGVGGGRIAAGTNQYYVSTSNPTLLCRSDADNSHRWAHRHQQIEGLAAIDATPGVSLPSGVVTVGLRSTINSTEANFIPESDFDH